LFSRKLGDLLLSLAHHLKGRQLHLGVSTLPEENGEAAPRFGYTSLPNYSTPSHGQGEDNQVWARPI